jgi:hypothetical protein
VSWTESGPLAVEPGASPARRRSVLFLSFFADFLSVVRPASPWSNAAICSTFALFRLPPNSDRLHPTQHTAHGTGHTHTAHGTPHTSVCRRFSVAPCVRTLTCVVRLWRPAGRWSDRRATWGRRWTEPRCRLVA